MLPTRFCSLQIQKYSGDLKKMFMKKCFMGIRMLAGKNTGTVLATATPCSQEPQHEHATLPFTCKI